VKFLIHSNGPNTKTGYGVQVAQLAEHLHDAGHDVAISATFGQQGSTGSWKPANPRNPEGWAKGIRVYQVGWALNGIDIVHNHALHWFGGEPLSGWIIVHGDVWSLAENPLLQDFNVLGWAPVDHFPVPQGVLEFFDNSKALPVAMSRFGERAFRMHGLDPVYVPLSVDTTVYKPTPTIEHGAHGTITGRELIGVRDESFVVGMVAMNKDPDDRKGFNEAFAGFAGFYRERSDAVLYVHSDKNGMGASFNLEELASKHGIPPHAIRFPDTYTYQMGWTAEMMAAAYTAFDVLLAPSHGEGFCVPLVEAQACGTPVIASDFSAQAELVGCGWKIPGQQLYDVAQASFYLMPFIHGIQDALEQSYTADLETLGKDAVEFAKAYDTDAVFASTWLPLLEQMTADPALLELDRDQPFEVDVIVPAMRRENLDRLIQTFTVTRDLKSKIILVTDDDIPPGSVETLYEGVIDHIGTGKVHTSYAEKVNVGFAHSSAPWVLLVGDDVEFHLGWYEAAKVYSERFDVIGTNDSLPGRVRNSKVASGDHADHFFVRRAYVDRYGACLDGPGVLAPTVYNHWFVDEEIIGLADARGVFTPCLEAVVEHHHPGYEGREDLREADPTYMRAVVHSGDDEKLWESRRPLVEMQRQTRGRR
jgi:glycosyltransferase involved in cell wall biosynthesis